MSFQKKLVTADLNTLPRTSETKSSPVHVGLITFNLFCLCKDYISKHRFDGCVIGNANRLDSCACVQLHSLHWLGLWCWRKVMGEGGRRRGVRRRRLGAAKGRWSGGYRRGQGRPGWEGEA